MTEKLYPVDYDEEAAGAAPKPGWEAPPARDLVAARAIIEAAVPKAGPPLSYEQLEALVCGQYIRGAGGQFLPMDDAPDASVDLAAAVAAVQVQKPVRGPAACASLTRDEVRAVVRAVADERRPTWKLKAEAAAALALEVEEKVKEK